MEWRKENSNKYFRMRGKRADFIGENAGKINFRMGDKATLNDSRRQAKVTGNEDWKTGLGKGEGPLLCGAKLGRNCKRFATEQGDVDEQGFN
jgi:hypothetical protein